MKQEQISYYDFEKKKEGSLHIATYDQELRNDISMIFDEGLGYRRKINVQLSYSWERAFKYGKDYYFIDTFDFGGVSRITIEVKFESSPDKVSVYSLKTKSWKSKMEAELSINNGKYRHTIDPVDPTAYYLVVYEYPENAGRN